MKRKTDNPKKQEIIDVTMNLIDKNGGALGVNLREIARIAGCSAPNIYNYFESFDDILNIALTITCKEFSSMLQQALSSAKECEDLLQVATKAFICYLVNYPGRINFFYFEKLNNTVYAQTQKSAENVAEQMAMLLIKESNIKLDESKAYEISSIVHWYIVGQLSEYITGRKIIEDRETYIRELIIQSKKVMDTLIINY